MAGQTVDRYLDELRHPLADDVRSLRAAILALDPAVTERVKWNAPSFVVDGVDRVTFRLAPRDLFQVVLHRDAGGRRVLRVRRPHRTRPLGHPDRGVVNLTAPGSLDQHQTAVLELVRRWIGS